MTHPLKGADGFQSPSSVSHVQTYFFKYFKLLKENKIPLTPLKITKKPRYQDKNTFEGKVLRSLDAVFF